jgi:hypothetical protein
MVNMNPTICKKEIDYGKSRKATMERQFGENLNM